MSQMFGELIGMLFIVLGSEALPFDERENHKRFADTVAEQLSLALANVKLRETLKNQSIRDPLTQLYNRRHLDEVFSRELHRAERHAEPLSLLVFDIDHFKDFNDRHGHDGGDAVLESVAETMREFFRTEDSAFRIGGEEFAVLLPDTGLPESRELAESLRETIGSRNVLHDGVALPPVTVSIGVAVYPEHGRDPATLLRAADEAMYAAKQQGRNRVSVTVQP
jgi:diguanylate cyclase (GGDEF)-like protein